MYNVASVARFDVYLSTTHASISQSA